MIYVSEKASERIKAFLANRGKGIGIRLGVKTSGCSGMSYEIVFADDIGEDDLVFEDKGVKVIVNPKFHVYIDGTMIDYVKDGLQEGFEFINPNVKDTCGCGESFHV